MADESALFTLSEVQAMAEAVRANIARVIVGKLDVIDLLLVALLSDGHILLEDAPGMGKTVCCMAYGVTSPTSSATCHPFFRSTILINPCA